MKHLVTSEIKRGLKAFLALIHPDKFAADNSKALINGETFKISSNLIDSFCSLTDDRIDDKFSLPIKLNHLEFYTSSDMQSQRHILPFSTELEEFTMTEGVFLDWQEAAISIFHLFTKATIEYDNRLLQALLVSKEPELDTKQVYWETPIIPPLEQILKDINSLQKVIRISPTLSSMEKRQAVESIWLTRSLLERIQSQNSNHPRLYIKSDKLFESEQSLPRSIKFLPPKFDYFDIIMAIRNKQY